mgnify:CR=1 FL=1
MALRELLASFGVEVDDKALGAFDKRLDGVVDKLKTFGSVFLIGAAAKGFAKFIQDQAEAGFQLKRTASMVGMSTDELQMWRHSANLAGETTEKFDRAMRFVLKNAGSAEFGLVGANKNLKRWGTSAEMAQIKGKLLGEQLLIFSDRLHAIPSQAKRTALAISTFGIAGAQVLPWLQEGSAALKEGFEDYKKLGGGMTKEYVEAATKVARQTRRIHLALVALKSAAVGPLLPYLQKAATKFIDWSVTMADYLKHTNLVITAIHFLSVAIGGVLVFKVIAATQAVLKMAKAMGILNASMTTGPLFLALIGLLALYLIIEDISVGIDGGESAFRRLLDKMMGTKEADKLLTEHRDNWTRLGEEFEKLMPLLATLGTELAQLFESMFPYVAGLAIDSLDLLVQTLRGVIAYARILGNVLTLDFEAAGQIIDKMGDEAFAPSKGYSENYLTTGANKLTNTAPYGAIYDAEGRMARATSARGTQLTAAQAAWDQGHPKALDGLDPLATHPTVPWRSGDMPYTVRTPTPYADAGSKIVNLQSHVEAHITVNGDGNPKDVANAIAYRLSGLGQENADTMAAVVP